MHFSILFSFHMNLHFTRGGQVGALISWRRHWKCKPIRHGEFHLNLGRLPKFCNWWSPPILMEIHNHCFYEQFLKLSQNLDLYDSCFVTPWFFHYQFFVPKYVIVRHNSCRSHTDLGFVEILRILSEFWRCSHVIDCAYSLRSTSWPGISSGAVVRCHLARCCIRVATS